MFDELYKSITAIVLVTAWLVRLEAKVTSVEKENQSLLTKHDALDSKIINQLTRVIEQLADLRESVAKIEGRLEERKGE